MTTATAPALTFTEVAVPVVTRGAADNPYTEAVRSLTALNSETQAVEPTGKALSFTLSGVVPSKNDKDREGTKEIVTALNQLTDAGNVLGVTVRKKYERKGKDTVVTFWTREKITHPNHGKKDKDEQPAKTAAEPAV